MAQKVELEVVHDKDTGLAMNVYRWRDGDDIRIECEVANRFVRGTVLPLEALAYEQALDRPRAESRRAMIEASLVPLAVSVPSV